jgi:hypothetical protein
MKRLLAVTLFLVWASSLYFLTGEEIFRRVCDISVNVEILSSKIKSKLEFIRGVVSKRELQLRQVFIPRKGL